MPSAIKKKASVSEEHIVKLLNTEQAAASLSMGIRTLQERMAAGEIGVIKIGKSVRFHPDDIRAFIDRNRIKPIGWKGRSA